MNLLALDTTLQACSAAVLRGEGDDRQIFAAFERRERGHAEAIMPMIHALMETAGLDWQALDRIAATTGPGSFTGVRVGVAAARGLALATGAALTGITTLAVIARGAMDREDEAAELIAAAADARRGQVYFALFDAAGRALCDHMALSPHEAAGLVPASRRVVLAGSGAGAVAEALDERRTDLVTVASDVEPEASVLAHMAVSRPPEDGPLRPVYLRPPDAKPQGDKAVPHL